jgi:hypothetical protein
MCKFPCEEWEAHVAAFADALEVAQAAGPAAGVAVPAVTDHGGRSGIAKTMGTDGDNRTEGIAASRDW